MSFLFVLMVTFNTTLDTYDKAEEAIYDIVGDYTVHPLTKSYDRRYNTGRILVNGSRKGGVRWELITSIVFFESSFRPEVLARDGKGSKGYMQIHGESVKYCQEKEGRKVDLDNHDDQIICGSHWIRYAIDKCNGNRDQGLARYATGYMCKYTDSKSVSGIVHRRMKLFNKLVDKYETAL